MNLSRKLGFLLVLGLALGLAATGAQARQGYDPQYGSRDPDPYQDDQGERYDDSRYGDPGYDDFDRGGQRYDDRSGQRRLVRCESQDRRTHYCNIDPRAGIRLARQLSSRRCTRGDTWGVNARGVWVTDGCRADFEVGYGGYGHVIRCESSDNRTRYCNADTRYGMRLVRQLSRTACVEGRTWGITRNGVWVSRGCRAEFSDRYRDRDRDQRY